MLFPKSRLGMTPLIVMLSTNRCPAPSVACQNRDTACGSHVLVSVRYSMGTAGRNRTAPSSGSPRGYRSIWLYDGTNGDTASRTSASYRTCVPCGSAESVETCAAIERAAADAKLHAPDVPRSLHADPLQYVPLRSMSRQWSGLHRRRPGYLGRSEGGVELAGPVGVWAGPIHHWRAVVGIGWALAENQPRVPVMAAGLANALVGVGLWVYGGALAGKPPTSGGTLTTCTRERRECERPRERQHRRL